MEDNMYRASMHEIRCNIVDAIAHKYVKERFVNCDRPEAVYDFCREVFRYLLITKGSIHRRRRLEYINDGVKPTDKFIKSGGFSGDFEGCITHIKNVYDITTAKTELCKGITMGKVIYHIMRMVYFNPTFIDIVEKRLNIKQRG